jgi:sulfate adenylyltransferase subunit 2
MSKTLNYLDELESEAIYILREVVGQFDKPAFLFSGGKDSICLVHLALKAFRPGKFPFPLLHIDTGHNFKETISYRDKLMHTIDEDLIVRYVANTIKSKHLQDGKGKFPSRNALQTYTLLDVISEFQFDACIGGARRDEEKSRAKERIFSVRDEFGQWNPKMQRPELWNMYNGKINKWTELDVWNYIKRENIELPSIYFSHDRECIVTESGQLMANNEFVQLDETDLMVTKKVRYRTVGDMTCTAAIESEAATVDEIINELLKTKISERGATRMDDRISEAAMEDRKKDGYF